MIQGKAIEFTPSGMIERTGDLYADVPGVGKPAGASIQAAKPKPRPQPEEGPAPTPKPAPKPAEELPTPGWPPPSPTPKRVNWVSQMKARLKVVEKELKKLGALEDERAELKRMIRAANEQPANVRSISARRSG